MILRPIEEVHVAPIFSPSLETYGRKSTHFGVLVHGLNDEHAVLGSRAVVRPPAVNVGARVVSVNTFKRKQP